MSSCILCGASRRDGAGELMHEPPCPHFMRGPDAGGDPAEWGTLEGAIDELEQARRRDVRRAEHGGSVLLCTIGGTPFYGSPDCLLAPGTTVERDDV